MKSKKSIFRIIEIIVVLCVLATMTFAINQGTDGGTKDPNRKEIGSIGRANGGGGGACMDCGGKMFSDPNREKNGLVPQTTTDQRPVGLNHHILAAPERFPKDGVYIWCDPDAVWTIFWRGREPLEVKATITATKPLIVKSAVKAKTKSLETRPNKLQVFNDPNSDAFIVQFASVADLIRVNLLVDSVADTNCVYIGSRLDNPKQFPVKLVTRRTSTYNETFPMQTATSQQLKGTLCLNKNRNVPKKEVCVPLPNSHSGGGKSRGGKVKR